MARNVDQPRALETLKAAPMATPSTTLWKPSPMMIIHASELLRWLLMTVALSVLAAPLAGFASRASSVLEPVTASTSAEGWLASSRPPASGMAAMPWLWPCVWLWLWPWLWPWLWLWWKKKLMLRSTRKSR